MENGMEPQPTTLARVEKITGAKPVSSRPINSGYTLAERWVMQLDNGISVFVKVATDTDTSIWLRDEAKVYNRVRADFLPNIIGWEDGEFPIMALEDLSAGEWTSNWTPEHIKRVVGVIEKLAATKAPTDLPSLADFAPKLTGWQEVETDPTPFLGLGLVSAEWLQASLPALVQAEKNMKLEGDSLVHLDIRSDNICFYGDRTLLVDWNWAHRGNSKFDLIFWLPSLCKEGGPPPWEFTLDEPEFIAAVAGYFAARAPRPPHAHTKAIRQLQLDQLKVALPWAVKALNLPQP